MSYNTFNGCRLFTENKEYLLAFSDYHTNITISNTLYNSNAIVDINNLTLNLNTDTENYFITLNIDQNSINKLITHRFSLVEYSQFIMDKHKIYQKFTTRGYIQDINIDGTQVIIEVSSIIDRLLREIN